MELLTSFKTMFRDYHLFIHLLGSVDLHFGLVICRNLDENRDSEYRGEIFPRLLSGPVDQGGIFCVIKIEKKMNSAGVGAEFVSRSNRINWVAGVRIIHRIAMLNYGVW